MSGREPWRPRAAALSASASNPYARMWPSYSMRARAARAGIDANDKAAVDAWIASGGYRDKTEPD